jgi:ATP-dependent RNA helicase RhlE
VPETYVHRIGRTARAGAAGTAISLCAAEELPLLRDIEKLIRRTIPEPDRRPPPMPHRRLAAQGPLRPAIQNTRPPTAAANLTTAPARDINREVRAAPPAGHPPKKARTPSGIVQVAFLQPDRPDRDSGPRDMGQRGGSRGR